MAATVLLALLGVGLTAGVVSGLIGIGGGVLMVPFLYFFYAHPEWSGFAADPDAHAVLAHATSLFVIVPASVLGTVSYHRAGLVVWRSALPMAASAVVAAVVGARLAIALPAELLKLGFGLLLLGVGVQFVRGRVETSTARRPGSAAWALLTGLVVGLVSALLGVGGGIIAIPFLIHAVGLRLERVAATSLAIVCFTALAGSVTYMVSGIGHAGLPRGSWGYVHVLAGLPLLVGALIAVRWGAHLNQRLPVPVLARVFAVFFVAIGLFLAIRNGAALL